MDTYGYKPLSYELITLFRSGAPDFAAAEDLIRRGADVNDQGDDKGENVLSEILMGYRDFFLTKGQLVYDEEYVKNTDGWRNLNPKVGESMIAVIRFFLEHGFDVNRNAGRHGAQCLLALQLSTFDAAIIDATKILLDAGAKNIPANDDPYNTPMTWMEEEQEYQDIGEHNHYLGNLYEAAYQVYVAFEAGRPYAGVSSFETAIGKKIMRVMADELEGNPVFSSIDVPTSKHENCFYCNLYLLFDSGYLIARRDTAFWVDTILPETPLVDVSPHFTPVIGAVINDITFGRNEVVREGWHYGQPITKLHMDNGITLAFTINFGEVDKKDYCAYYYFE